MSRVFDEVGSGQKVRPLLKSIFSCMDGLYLERFTTALSDVFRKFLLINFSFFRNLLFGIVVCLW